MANSNSGFMPNVNKDSANVSTGGGTSGGITDKLKNLAKPESHAAGMMGMGGMGGPGGTAAASALGSNVPSVPSHTSGMSNVDTPDTHSYNRDSSHSGFSGHNSSSDNYGRDTTNSETYGRGNPNIERNQGYSMDNDRRNINNTHMSGYTTSSGMATSGLGTGASGAGDIDESNLRHQTVDADSHLKTDTTRTGAQSGTGIHAQQYSGREGGISTASGVGTRTRYNDLSDQHHLHGQTKQAGCGMCQSGGHSMHDSNSSNISSQQAMGMSGNSTGDVGHGQAKMTTTTSTGTTEGPSNFNLRPGERVVETETRVHQGQYASGTGSGNTRNSSQDMGGMGHRQPATGPVGSGQQPDTGKASMTDKIIGGAEKMTGKMSGNAAIMKDGEQRIAGQAAANLSRN